MLQPIENYNQIIRVRWQLVLLGLVALSILILAYLLNLQPKTEVEFLPVGISSNRIANYSGGRLSVLLPAVSFDIVGSVIEEQGGSNDQVSDILATLSKELLTPVPTVTPSPAPTETQRTIIVSGTPVTVTLSPSVTSAPTQTPGGPTATNNPFATATQVPLDPTATRTPLGTATQTPQGPTVTSLPTQTPGGPTATQKINTPTPTFAPTSTSTKPPSLFPTHTPTATLSSGSGPTNTAVPTATLTRTLTNSPTATLTSLSSPTPGATPTKTATATIIPSLTNSPTPQCSAPRKEEGYVKSVFPEDGAKDVPVDVIIKIVFNQPVDPTTFKKEISIRGPGKLVYSIFYDPRTLTLEVEFLEELKLKSEYHLVIKRNIENICGDRQEFEISIEFKTVK
ncbi:MAG: Ig-like domain-containing protein [Chloroflexota bacterium]